MMQGPRKAESYTNEREIRTVLGDVKQELVTYSRKRRVFVLFGRALRLVCLVGSSRALITNGVV